MRVETEEKSLAAERPVTRAVLAHKACEILAKKQEPYRTKALFKDLEASLPLTAEQLEPVPSRPEFRQFERDLNYTTVNESRARWLVKSKGTWALTDAGREAVLRFTTPEEFHSEAQRLYLESMKAEGPRKRGGPVDRTSAAYAADLIETFYPDEAERQACLAQIAGSIKVVSGYPPEIWSITLNRRMVRLNVGRLAAVTLGPGSISLMVDNNILSEQLKTEVAAVGGVNEVGTVTASDIGFTTLPAGRFDGFAANLEPAHTAAVKRAAEAVKRTPYLGSHSPGVVDYINEELGEEIVGPQLGAVPPRGSERSLADAIAAWDRQAAAPRVREAEALRQSLVAAFSITSWPTLSLENYALGAAPESFCYWMEYKTPSLGSIAGGSARKHIVYKKTAGPGWYFDPSFKDEVEAWQSVRSGFVEAFQLIESGDYAAVDSIPALRSGPALRTKAAFAYFPDRFLPIYSSTHLAHFARLLGSVAVGLENVAANRHLHELVYSKSEFNGWSPLEVMYFLYDWADPRQSRRIVKIAPGERARFWDDCRSDGYICVGWDEIGDLTRFATKQDFKTAFMTRYGDSSRSNLGAAGRKAEELWTLMELQQGDLVIANRGTSQILSLGTVNGQGYFWNEDRPEFKHTVGVDWDDSYARSIEPISSWATTTVAPISPELYRQLIGTDAVVVPADETLSEIAEAMDRKGQMILYGPPGTGKTYVSRRFAVWWLRQKNGANDASAALADGDLLASVEEDLTKSGQLKKVTFHPSYAYEDFVEGFKPVNSDGGGLKLELKDGIFKSLCEAADKDPGRPYLLLIDEINRGNIPKIFGELITLLELDKRGLSTILPQSGEWFSVPANVYILGTMNTADRSIRLLDTALRRRFAFKELMPDPSLLANSLVGPLALDGFLKDLNTRIARSAGREKQIGHAYLMNGTRAISTPEDFSARFRQDILPLLQEYAYDNYALLADYLSPSLVDVEQLELRGEIIANPDTLLAALHESFGEPRRAAVLE
jgi:5-methylcytosine-specific restriction protein B